MEARNLSLSVEWIQSLIGNFITHSPENHLADANRERAFDKPLVGFSNGADPIFNDYKQHVGQFHWTPQEIFSLTFSHINAAAEDLTVISWVLPQTKAAKSDNRRKKQFPSERWVRARIFGEQVNVKLRQYVVQSLTGRGFETVAPMLAPQWEKKISEEYGYASTWSERHIAYACGLGTFGLSDGLITPLGKAMRVGSAVVNCKLPVEPRPYTDHHAYCLHFTHGICGKCIARCPAGAITAKGHDKVKCKAYLRNEVAEYILSSYGFENGRGCGLCQTKVPCESRIPVKSNSSQI